MKTLMPTQDAATEHIRKKKIGTLLDLCVSSLRRSHVNLLCIAPILPDDPRRESGKWCISYVHVAPGTICAKVC